MNVQLNGQNLEIQNVNTSLLDKIDSLQTKCNEENAENIKLQQSILKLQAQVEKGYSMATTLQEELASKQGSYTAIVQELELSHKGYQCLSRSSALSDQVGWIFF